MDPRKPDPTAVNPVSLVPPGRNSSDSGSYAGSQWSVPDSFNLPPATSAPSRKGSISLQSGQRTFKHKEDHQTVISSPRFTLGVARFADLRSSMCLIIEMIESSSYVFLWGSIVLFI